MQDFDTVRAWVRPRLAWWLRGYLGARLRQNEPVYSERALSYGLIDRREQWAAMRETVSADVIPRFVKRGLLEAEVGFDDLVAEYEAMNGVPPG